LTCYSALISAFYTGVAALHWNADQSREWLSDLAWVCCITFWVSFAVIGAFTAGAAVKQAQPRD
jgi:hypothetical protein